MPDPNFVRFTGYEKEMETGLEYAQARYFNPTHGWYTSIDPHLLVQRNVIVSTVEF